MARKLSDLIFNFTNNIIVILCFGLVAVMFFSVFERYILNTPLIWANDMSIFIFIWMSFLGMSTAVKLKEHITFDFISHIFSKKALWKISYFIKILSLIITSICVIVGCQLFIQMLPRFYKSINLSLGWLYLALPVGFFITFFHIISDLLYLHGTKNNEK